MWHWDSLFTFGIFIVIMKKGKESEEGLQYNKRRSVCTDMQDNLREMLIRQFPAEVVEMSDPMGNIIYACPTCKRPVALGTDKCSGCGQALGWTNIKRRMPQREARRRDWNLKCRLILHRAIAENVRFPILPKKAARMFTNVH